MRTLAILTCVALTLAPVNAQDLAAMVRGLRTAAEVDDLWARIRIADQDHRGAGTTDLVDNRNFKLMVLLIQHHGFPIGNITPHIVFTHQRSAYVREFYFPILHQAYKDGKADTYWFMHNVRGLHRGRYGFDLLQPKDSTYEKVLARMEVYLNDEVCYDINPFDSLYSSYMEEITRITSATAKHRWVNDVSDRISIHQVGNELYMFKLFSDGSFGMPQRIQQDTNSNTYTYSDPANKAYLVVDEAGNLTIKGDRSHLEHFSVDRSH